MKLTIEDESFDGSHRKVMIEESVTTMEELTELFIQASLALGYHPTTVHKWLAPERLEE